MFGLEQKHQLWVIPGRRRTLEALYGLADYGHTSASQTHPASAGSVNRKLNINTTIISLKILLFVNQNSWLLGWPTNVWAQTKIPALGNSWPAPHPPSALRPRGLRPYTHPKVGYIKNGISRSNLVFYGIFRSNRFKIFFFQKNQRIARIT